ncbi:MAG: HAD-IB family phosphatase [Planctomycetes bacterium]|nr:HAD-IB family phosphatase [Planctomycetota bacterium]
MLFRAVYFDCDSTLATIEGVDELIDAIDPGLRVELAELTERAMNGQVPLAEVYETRLARIAPRRDLLHRVGELYVQNEVPHARDVVQALRASGKHVGIISGGLLLPVRMLARDLGIPEVNVHAVPLEFTASGDYVDFDRRSPLWQNGGKVEVLLGLPAEHRPVAFVGDGATDLETQMDGADLFVGFGGVAAREIVRSNAEAWVPGPSLAGVLRHVLTAGERARLRSQPRFSELLSAAEE